jgi:hypothetical protein
MDNNIVTLVRGYDKFIWTRQGFPAIWEYGGSYQYEGESQIICDSNGNRMKPMFIPKHTRNNSNHALFIVRKGDYIIKCKHHRFEYIIQVLRVEGIYQDYLECVLEYETSTNADIPDFLKSAVNAAIRKAGMYKCHQAMYTI